MLYANLFGVIQDNHIYLQNDWSIKQTLYNDNTSPIKYFLNSQRFQKYMVLVGIVTHPYIFIHHTGDIVFNFTVVLFHALYAKQATVLRVK